MVSVCVAILRGILTDDISLDYTISAYSQIATGKYLLHTRLALNTAILTETEDYGSIIIPDSGTFSLENNATCHSIMIYDDESVEPPETFAVSITATGPLQEVISLFNITVPQAVVQIVDNDSE